MTVAKTVVVQYKTHEHAADENQKLVEEVFAQLNQADPGGVRYATFRLADGVSFVHVAVIEGEENPLQDIPAFKEFQSGIGDRAAAPPESAAATMVGSYRFMAP
jgi:hypothetical protein